MRQIFLVDNSVLQRVHRSVPVKEALTELLAAGDFGGCLPQLLEEGYSARSADEHAILLDANRRAKIFLPPDGRVAEIAVDLQSRLFNSGAGRSVGVSDLQIAATAIRHTDEAQRVVVVHYDADFENVARIAPEFAHRWIVPHGSVH
ncbi:PIN domain-containing protein [Microbacterium sp. KUDC0406]|uniref:PIN domain-containing protein n=1 Tax=Microbacterium sp. KUDC0406 TaxID=2909588 RepID=UPI001F3BC742|nr:PIN domain-containing protein [Microbacterium sp. KUDC0406]UJP09580.1 PIN domain-containing protein [Microbacterium sp. KUDC0406]